MTSTIVYFVRSNAFRSLGSRIGDFPLFYPAGTAERITIDTEETLIIAARARVAHALLIIFATESGNSSPADFAAKILHGGRPSEWIDDPYKYNTQKEQASKQVFASLIPVAFKAPLKIHAALGSRRDYGLIADTTSNRLADALWYVAFGDRLPVGPGVMSRKRTAGTVSAAPQPAFSPNGNTTRLSLQASAIISRPDHPDGHDHHVYLYLCGTEGGDVWPGSCACTSSKPPPAPSHLQSIYAGARGYMWRLADGPVEVEFTGRGTHIGAAVFARISDYSGSPTVAPIYDVISRGFAPRAQFRSLTTFAGPLSTRFEFDKANDYATKLDFKYEKHYQIHVSEDGGAPQEFPAPLSEDQRVLNRVIEELYTPVDAAGIKDKESFIYRGLTSMVPILVVGYLEPDHVPERIFAQSLDRLYRRRGIYRETFIKEMVKGSVNPELRRMLFIEAVAVVNTMVYVPDQVFGKDADVHESVRLTNSGDCEDFAEAMLRIFRHMQRHPIESIKRPDVMALYRYVQESGAECMMAHMRVNYQGITSHAVSAAMVPARKACSDTQLCPDREHRLIFLDGTTPENCSFGMSDSPFCKKMEQIAGTYRKGAVEFYREPSPDRASGRQFYRGFVGAVICPRESPPRYAFFVEQASAKEVASGDGVSVLDVTVRGEYVLRVPAASAGLVDGKVEKELRRVATFVPPLPPGGADEADGAFTAEYGEWLKRVKDAVGEKLSKDDKPIPDGKRGFSVYINMAGISEKLEAAIETVRHMAEQPEVGVVIVDGFATFKGTAIIEVLFKELKR